MPRPTKLTIELTEVIAGHIRDGNYPEVAASLAGISPSTFYLWMDRGRKGVAPFLEFLESIERAQARATIDRVAYIVRAAEVGHWRAAAWLLERTRPEQYGKRSRGVMEWDEHRQGQPYEGSGISVEELEDKVRQIKLMRGE